MKMGRVSNAILNELNEFGYATVKSVVLRSGLSEATVRIYFSKLVREGWLRTIKLTYAQGTTLEERLEDRRGRPRVAYARKQ